jgi:uncharacterized protein involved in exopolysaccharide biosynthesis
MDTTAAQPSIREMLVVAFRYKRAILIAFMIPVIALIILAYSTQKQYQADSKVMVRAGREFVPASDTGDRNTIPPSTTMQEVVDTEVEILTSKEVLQEVVDAVGIARLYPVLAGITPPHPILAWLSEQLGQSWPMQLPALFTWHWPSSDQGAYSVRNLAVEALGRDLKVKPVKLSNVIDISIRNTDRDIASETLRQLLAIFQVHHVSAFRQQRSSVLEEQIGQNLTEIAKLEKARAEYRNINLLFAAGEQRSALVQQRAHSLQELQDTRIEQGALHDKVEYLAEQLQKLPKNMKLDTATQPSSGAQSVERSLQELKAKEGLYATRFNPNSLILQDLRANIVAHQEVVGKAANLNVVRTGLNPVLPTLETQLMTTRSELAPLETKGADLSAAITGIDEQLKGLSVNELQLLNLDRRIGELDLATNTLRQRLEDARFLDELDHEHLTSVKVIDGASTPEKPASPRKFLYGLVGLACGFLAATCAFLLALTFGNRFLSVDMIERVLGVPVVAVLPLMPPQTRHRAAWPIARAGAQQHIAPPR